MEKVALVSTDTNSKISEESFSCLLCPRSFESRRGLGQHLRSCRRENGNVQENSAILNNSNFHVDFIRPTSSLPNSVPVSTVCSNVLSSSVQPNVTPSIFTPLPNIWGSLSLEDVTQVISAIYEEAVYWKRNLFKLPSGKPGKEYIDECTRLVQEWINNSQLKLISLKALMIMPSILLQKPSKNSKAKQHSESLRKRLDLWKSGDFDSLVKEVRFVQSKLKFQKHSRDIENIAKRFNNLMLAGKINAALRLLSDSDSCGILPLNDQTMNLLHSKHPQAEDQHVDLLLHGPEQAFGEYAYEILDGALINKVAREMKGASGPSNLDSDGWRRILTSKSFGLHSTNLCEALASMARKLCIDRECGKDGSLEAFLASKLIPLDKNPGLRPIGVGELLRRILGRAVMKTFKADIQCSAGDLQLCAGQRGGCEAAVHAMASTFADEDCDAMLLVDADNAFNRINRKVLLHNICIICPIIATYVINSYQHSARLFVTGGVEIHSEEGTTQGDPTAMPIYALGSIPLLDSVFSDETIQAAYADDLSVSGTLKSLLSWWNTLSILGPKIGYFPKASKSWLIVKPDKLESANLIFMGSNINITSEGKRYLRAIIGSPEFKRSFVETKVSEWVNELQLLAEIAKFHPQSAYCAFTGGYRHKFNYIMRTIPAIGDMLQPVEDVIRNKLIPSICENRACSDAERDLLSLPVKLGGMGILNVTRVSEIDYNTSKYATFELTRKIYSQNGDVSPQVRNADFLKKSIYHQQLLVSLRENMSPTQLKANVIAQSDGASIWLSTMPLKNEGFDLTKREFFDAVHLRYCWSLQRLPVDCICGGKFNVDHALSCKVGGFVILRHNELVNLTADLLSSVCKDVSKEPVIQSSPANDDEIRADVCARGFWQRLQRAFVDVRVFYPFAPSYRNSP